jgi:ribonuclease-3
LSRKQDKILKGFQKSNHLKFKNPQLLEEALTHRSYVNEHEGEEGLVNNERLEFLGDSVLNFISAELLFRRFPSMTEGDLTRMRSALVRTESLAALAAQIHIGDTLRMGKGEIANGGRERINNLCDAFEALVGAIFMDQGVGSAREFVKPLLESLLEQVLADQLDRDARSTLQEWSQATYNLTPMYRIAAENGPEHDKEFTIEVTIGENVAGVGTGRSKQAASHAAARDALLRVHEAELAASAAEADAPATK